MSLAAAGDPPVPPPGGGGDLGGHGSNSSRPPRAGRGRGKKLAPRQLKHRVVYNRNLTDMPRRVLEDGTEVPLEPDPEEETRVDTEITRADLLAPDENLLVDRHGRVVLMPYADDFQPQKHASVAITKTIVANYHEPFISWKEVKKNKKAWESFWNSFRTGCTWMKHFDKEMIKLFNKKCSKRMSTMMSNLRCTRKKPDWIGDNSWPILEQKWNEPKYKDKCGKAKANRASEKRGGSIHSGGSTSGATFRAEFWKIHGREPSMCEMHEFFHRRPDGTWDSTEAERVQTEMDAFEAAFDTQQNTLPPSERADEVTRSTIMLDQFVVVAGGMPRNRVRGQGNTSSLVIRTPMGYRFDSSNSFGSVDSCSSTAQSYSAADYQEMERRLKADNDARLQSRLDEMRSQLREEARQDMELMVQRVMSQRDQGYQPQQPQQHPQHIPPRHSAYASSHPYQQQPRHSPHMPARHSVHETSRFQPIQPQSSCHESGGSSQHPEQLSGTYSYQQLSYRPTFDNNQSTSQVPPFNAATHRANVNLMNDQDLLEEFLGPDNQVGNQGGNQDRSGGRGTGGRGNENSNNTFYRN